MPMIELQNLTKVFGEATAVNSINLEIANGEFFSMLGPSGCGKTTTLRMIAGFEEATSGRILLAHPPRRRDEDLLRRSGRSRSRTHDHRTTGEDQTDRRDHPAPAHVYGEPSSISPARVR